jgi:hypothetical protein
MLRFETHENSDKKYYGLMNAIYGAFLQRPYGKLYGRGRDY